MDKTLIGYCGVDCSACRDFQINLCEGCRKSEGDCMPINCCKEKGVSVCGECTEFPCDNMKGFYKESDSHEQAYKLMKSINSEK